jgi:YidC/Oxa1 family membrane protein insertase
MWDLLIINPMVNTLLFIYSIIGNFGIAIILFTILIRLITYPLTVQQIKGTQKMQEFQKSQEWADLQKKYKDDKQKLQQEQMKLYQEMGINPLGSCLPTLIQFPIIIGLYQAIIRALAVTPVQTLDLYGHIYPFINAAKLIPINNNFLWMNLSQPERFYIFGIGIPVLAIVVVVTTFMQSKLMTPPAQPGEQGAQMAQAMNLYMPLLMGYLALTFASGLSLYFVASNVVTIGQYAAMGKVEWSNLLPGNLLKGLLPARRQSDIVQSKSATKPAPSSISKTSSTSISKTSSTSVSKTSSKAGPRPTQKRKTPVKKAKTTPKKGDA